MLLCSAAVQRGNQSCDLSRCPGIQLTPDQAAWFPCLLKPGLLPLHMRWSLVTPSPLSNISPVNLPEDSDLYAVCAGSQMPCAVNFWFNEGRAYSWKWSKRKACSFVQWDKACCVFCFWCLKDGFFPPSSSLHSVRGWKFWTLHFRNYFSRQKSKTMYVETVFWNMAGSVYNISVTF